MKNKKLIINIAACLVSFATVIGINFFLTPYITKNIGTDAYGFVSLATNFVNYASIITLAINSMATRFVSIAVFQNKKEQASIYFTTILYANIFIILILFIPTIICILFLDKLINIPVALIPSVKILFSLIFFNFYLGLISSTFCISTYAADKIELYTLRNMESSILKIIIMFILFYIFDASVIIIGIATLCATLYQFAFYYHYKNKFLPFVKIKKKYFELKKVFEIFLAGIWNTLTRIGQILSDGLDLLIANLFINPIAMGQLSIAKVISSSVSLLTVSLVNVFQPSITRLYATNDSKVTDEIKFAMKVVSFLSNILLSGILALGVYFYKMWLPEENTNLLYTLTVITLFSNVIGTSVNPLFSVFTITNKLKINSIITLVTGFLNVLIVYVLIKADVLTNPIYAVASVSVITGAIINLTFVPMYSAHCLGKAKTTFYEPILKSLISIVLLVGIFWGISKLIVINSWLKLLIVGAISSIIGIGVSIFIMFNKSEINKILLKLNGHLRKVKLNGKNI